MVEYLIELSFNYRLYVEIFLAMMIYERKIQSKINRMKFLGIFDENDCICRLHSMQRIHLKHHMLRGHRDIAFSLHLVIDLGRSHFHCPFSIQEWVGIL
jgi:hypothetical protein